VTAVLREQQEYYDARAGEYDEWWERRGRYDRGPELNDRWRAEIAQVEDVLEAAALNRGEVVELAAGTGNWTAVLTAHAAHLTVVDGSAEMLALNRARLGPHAHAVAYQQADLFSWVPERTWDLLVHCFWISHVPRRSLAAFFATCRRALAPGGTMFFLDGLPTETSTAVDHVLPVADSEVMVRRLNDGREFNVVKNFYTPAELQAAAGEHFSLTVDRTDTFFQFAVGVAR
jgi:ubiquinone/menaquinone biosynthesis C-methylase UbiE